MTEARVSSGSLMGLWEDENVRRECEFNKGTLVQGYVHGKRFILGLHNMGGACPQKRSTLDGDPHEDAHRKHSNYDI